MKHLLVSAMAVALAFATVSAYAQKKEGAHRAAPVAKDVVKAPLEDMTLTGKIAQQERTRTGKDGVEVKIEQYTLIEAGGTVVSLNSLKKTDAAPVDLAKYVGKDVKIVGQGRTETTTAGKKVTHLVSLKTLEEVLPATGAAK